MKQAERKKLIALAAIVAVCAGLMLSGSAAQAGFIDNHDGTVTDNGTGLMWQQATAPDTYTWEDGLAYCQSLDFAGHTDWRLPTAKELASLVDNNRYEPAINTTFFPDTRTLSSDSSYWSSTTNTYSTNYAWSGLFYNGYMYSYNKANNFYVRAVRSGQFGAFEDVTLWSVPDTGQTTCYSATDIITCPQPGQPFYGQDACSSINTPAYTKLADNCVPLAHNAATWSMVRDAVTGLVWEEKHAMDDFKNYVNPNDADNAYTWYDNNSATNGGDAGTPGGVTDTMDFIKAMNTVNYGGFSDWRMPTVKELQTIVDYDRYDPSINMTYFPNTVSSLYWSSTSAASNAGLAWYVFFKNGYVDNYPKSMSNYYFVRAVRSGGCGSFGDLFIFKPGTGAGTVASADGLIDCGSHCTEAYTQSDEVMLTATAASGSTFTGWSGGGCSGLAGCTVTMDVSLTVTANFDLNPTTTTTIVTTTTTQPTSTTTSIAPTTTTTTISGPCPARQLLGADNPKLENLRDFRDSKLAHSALGRRIIDMYYNNAGSINAVLHRSPALQAAARRVLEAIAPMVGRKE